MGLSVSARTLGHPHPGSGKDCRSTLPQKIPQYPEGRVELIYPRVSDPHYVNDWELAIVGRRCVSCEFRLSLNENIPWGPVRLTSGRQDPDMGKSKSPRPIAAFLGGGHKERQRSGPWRAESS